MRCASARNHFDELFDGRLEAVVRQRVEEHLAGCTRCAESYEAMRRILTGVAEMPRPRAPHLEVSPPAGLLPEPGAVPISRRRPQRVAAAAGLLLALAITHVLAYWLGDNRNREMAGIAREELSRLADDHFDRTASQLRVARALAEEDPAAARRLALRDPVADQLRRRSRALLGVSDEPALGPIRERLERYVRLEDSVFNDSDPVRIRREIPRLEKQLTELMQILHQQSAPKIRTAAPRTAEDAIRTARRLLYADRPADAGQQMARYYLKQRDSTLAKGQLSILVESSARVGEVREMEAMQGLIRATGPAGMAPFLGNGGPPGARARGPMRSGHRVLVFRIGGRSRPVLLPMLPNGQFGEFADIMRMAERAMNIPGR